MDPLEEEIRFGRRFFSQKVSNRRKVKKTCSWLAKPSTSLHYLGTTRKPCPPLSFKEYLNICIQKNISFSTHKRSWNRFLFEPGLSELKFAKKKHVARSFDRKDPFDTNGKTTEKTNPCSGKPSRFSWLSFPGSKKTSWFLIF